ncbi:ABC transporter permease [Parapusillimonas granuli]|uniref:ABC transporter permease n=1 Tax=Parapusillimonas granuli TaxID=380911 RepID=A0A853FVA3_9BURK|nr:ABC transporter permease [Parapusillimonas granuli]MBB5216607.1 putative spermidine/putrescine transport system permease protein [Parapusillimonas granuli]MEB2399652.1 ABC transporter permease [Alcaligenaceae bacterium]NYT48087.1 ABC transporter permease [Parapusillimonas granuli]
MGATTATTLSGPGRQPGSPRPALLSRGAVSNTLMAGPMVVLMLAGYVLPGLLMLSVSLGGALGSWPFQSPMEIDQYRKIFSSSYFWGVMGFTLLVSVGVALLNAFLAYPVALFLARSRSRWNGVCFLITFTPLAVGMNMLTMGWLVMLGKNGVLNALIQGLGLSQEPLPLIYGIGAVVAGLAHISFTFMVLPLESVLRGVNPALELASRSLGASRWRTFLTVTLPLSWEGLAAGMLIVFMQSCGAFVIPLLLGGSSTIMLPVSIWEQMTVANDRASGAALAMMLTFVALVALALQLRYFNVLKEPNKT